MANSGSYAPPALPSARAVTITLYLDTKGRGTCRGAIAFRRTTLPALMARVGGGWGLLPYVIQTAAGGGTSLLFSGHDPDRHRLDFSVPSDSEHVTLTVYVLQQPAAGPISAGVYADNDLWIKVYNRDDGELDLVGYRPFIVTGTVLQSCQLPAPSVSSLNFTPAISKGLPNAGYTLTATFLGVSCTAPARIRLSGIALQPATPVSPVANFDNFIDWQASASFGAANVVLNTTVANQATSAHQNVISGAASNVTINVNVNLLPGRRIIAGTYSGVLTVTIDPDL